MIELVELSSSEVPGLWLRELSSPPVGQLTCFTMGGRYGMNGPGFPALKRCPCAGLGRGRRLLGDLGSERTPSRTMRIPGGLRAGVRGGASLRAGPEKFQRALPRVRTRARVGSTGAPRSETASVGALWTTVRLEIPPARGLGFEGASLRLGNIQNSADWWFLV